MLVDDANNSARTATNGSNERPFSLSAPQIALPKGGGAIRGIGEKFSANPIGTIRREYLDQMLFWTAADLENKLLDFRTYFNSHRTHTSLEGRTPDAPASRPIVNLRSFGWQSHCRNLYQTPVA